MLEVVDAAAVTVVVAVVGAVVVEAAVGGIADGESSERVWC